jgi:hypothetical protein
VSAVQYSHERQGEEGAGRSRFFNGSLLKVLTDRPTLHGRHGLQEYKLGVVRQAKRLCCAMHLWKQRNLQLYFRGRDKAYLAGLWLLRSVEVIPHYTRMLIVRLCQDSDECVLSQFPLATVFRTVCGQSSVSDMAFSGNAIVSFCLETPNRTPNPRRSDA